MTDHRTHSLSYLGKMSGRQVESANGDAVRFIAVSFGGPHTYDSYKKAFFEGKTLFKRSTYGGHSPRGVSAFTTASKDDNQSIRIDRKKVVLGWYNYTRNTYYWVRG